MAVALLHFCDKKFKRIPKKIHRTQVENAIYVFRWYYIESIIFIHVYFICLRFFRIYSKSFMVGCLWSKFLPFFVFVCVCLSVCRRVSITLYRVGLTFLFLYLFSFFSVTLSVAIKYFINLISAFCFNI